MVVQFYHQTFPPFASPSLTGNHYEVSLHAQTTEDPPRIILDDQDGDTHPIDPVEGVTAKDRVRPGCKTLIANIAARLGISVTVADIEEIAAP